MKRKKKIMLAGGIIVFLLIIVAGWRIATLNMKYPNPQIITYGLSEPIKGGGIEITVTGKELVSMACIRDRIPNIQDNVLDEKGDILSDSRKKILLVNLEVKNLTDADQEISLTQFMAQTQVWSNGMDLYTYLSLNNLQAAGIQLKAQEKRNITMPFYMYDFQFKKGEFDKIENRKFTLVLSTYPIKNVVNLQ